jgi:hypothetical protein
VKIWLSSMKGGSTGHMPNHVRIIKLNIKLKNKILLNQKNWFPLIFFLKIKGLINKIIILIKRAITPPILLGIARKIAYANKKYHSGWIWIGVTIGLAKIKLSGSLNK